MKNNALLVIGTVGMLSAIDLMVFAISDNAKPDYRVLVMLMIPTAFFLLHLMWLEEGARKRALDSSKKILRWRSSAKIIRKTTD